jgi:hypothetical protein
MIGALISLIGLYLVVGVGVAIYEAMQTDGSFDWTTIVTWLYKIFK